MPLLLPTWTQEWRPLLQQLYARLTTTKPSTTTNSTTISNEELVLHVTCLIEHLYSCQDVSAVPQDLDTQTQALAVKYCIHSYEEKASRLLQLASQCDAPVLKLLYELAVDSAVDIIDTQMTTGNQNGLEDDRIRFQAQKLQQEQDHMINDQLVHELREICTSDEWYEISWDDSSHEDESEWDFMDCIEEKKVKDNEDVDVCKLYSYNETSGILEKEKHKQHDVVLTSRDSWINNGLSRSEIQHAEEETACQLKTEQQQPHHHHRGLEEMTIQDELLCRYYPEVTLQDKQKVRHDPMCKLDMKLLVPFTFDRPWLLCKTVAKCTENVCQRLIHEKTVVRMVFEALNGVNSLLFEFHLVTPTPVIFSIDFQTKAVERSRKSFDVAVGHLSPSAFEHMLGVFAIAASELQLLRDLLEFIRQAQYLNNHRRCVTLEGLANSLSEIVQSLHRSISTVEEQTIATASIQDEEDPWSGATTRQPTLLGMYSGLKEIFTMVSWLKWMLIETFKKISDRQWHRVRRAEQAKSVLDSLYRMAEVECVEGVTVNTRTSAGNGLSRSDVLLNLFVGALNPYLDLIDRTVFGGTCLDTMSLDEELFFVTPVSLRADALPTSGQYRSFREDLSSLAPFKVDRSLVPTFLEPKIEVMNRALASQQIKKHVMRHQQHLEPLTKSEQSRPSLRKLLTAELETMGYIRNGSIYSMTTSSLLGDDESPMSLQQIVLECVPFSKLLEGCFANHLETKCRELNGEVTDIFRDKMKYMEHIEALRMFVLMEQQDVFNVFCDKIVTHMQENPVAWADSEAITSFHQSAVQGVFENNLLSFLQRQVGSQLCVHVDFDLLPDSTSSDARIDIATVKCMYFTFAIQQPLRVLFSTSIMHKYSKLGVFLVQVKAVESAIVKFKSTLRYRHCYALIEEDMRHVLLQIVDMLHYTKSLLSYLTTQVSSEGWSKCRQILQSSRNLAEMNAMHEEYLDHLLSRFFLLDKHATVIQYILTTFNHILRFVGHVDEFVSVVDRNIRVYFPEWWSEDRDETKQVVQKCTRKVSSVQLLGHPDFRILRSEMTRSSKEFKRQSHFLVVMLTAMQKHGASPHINEILTQLNFNYFYHQQEHQR